MVDRRKYCSGLCMVLVPYLFPSPLLRPKKSLKRFIRSKKTPKLLFSSVTFSLCFFFQSANHDADRRPLVYPSAREAGRQFVHKLELYFVSLHLISFDKVPGEEFENVFDLLLRYKDSHFICKQSRSDFFHSRFRSHTDPTEKVTD